MASIVAVADGLETRCATISGLTAASEWTDTPIVPAVLALPAERDFIVRTTFGGRYTVTFRLLVVVSESPGIGEAFRNLYAYLDTTGSTSIIAALAADTTLGGVAEDIDLGSAIWRGVGFHKLGAVDYVGAYLDNVAVYVAS